MAQFVHDHQHAAAMQTNHNTEHYYVGQRCVIHRIAMAFGTKCCFCRCRRCGMAFGSPLNIHTIRTNAVRHDVCMPNCLLHTFGRWSAWTIWTETKNTAWHGRSEFHIQKMRRRFRFYFYFFVGFLHSYEYVKVATNDSSLPRTYRMWIVLLWTYWHTCRRTKWVRRRSPYKVQKHLRHTHTDTQLLHTSSGSVFGIINYRFQ